MIGRFLHQLVTILKTAIMEKCLDSVILQMTRWSFLDLVPGLMVATALRLERSELTIHMS